VFTLYISKVGSTPASHAGNSGFKNRSADRLFFMMSLMVFFSPSHVRNITSLHFGARIVSSVQ
jgi:hypothetical protein